jgi:hypothetical protein
MENRLQQVWLSHYSINEWTDPEAWASYLSEVQLILDAKLVRLDAHDPVRRKVTSLDETGEYICDFGEKEESRYLFAKFDKVATTFSIQHYRRIPEARNQFPNGIIWHFPPDYLNSKENGQKLKALFKWSNQSFSPFYAYSDTLEHIVNKKKKSGSVSFEVELLGVSWLNYFNDAYVNFFGRKKFEAFPEVIDEKSGGITTCLAQTPFDVPSHLREELAVVLGRESFVNPADILNKPVGKYALSYKQLREGQALSTSK